MPEPDVVIGLMTNARQVPGWRESTIEKWLDRRPEPRQVRRITIVRASDMDNPRKWARIVRTVARQYGLPVDEAESWLMDYIGESTMITLPS